MKPMTSGENTDLSDKAYTFEPIVFTLFLLMIGLNVSVNKSGFYYQNCLLGYPDTRQQLDIIIFVIVGRSLLISFKKNN